MKRVLLTGMSGTGKSTVIRELARRGYKAIDTDYDGWSHWINMDTGLPASPPAPGEYGWEDLDWIWHEERMQALLSVEDEDILFVAGTSPNQGKFYARFAQIILLSAPAEVIIDRLMTRTNNPYGATPRTLPARGKGLRPRPRSLPGRFRKSRIPKMGCKPISITAAGSVRPRLNR